MVPSLPPWFENRKKRQARAPKVYVRDTGLPHALPGIPGEDMMPGHRTDGVMSVVGEAPVEPCRRLRRPGRRSLCRDSSAPPPRSMTARPSRKGAHGPIRYYGSALAGGFQSTADPGNGAHIGPSAGGIARDRSRSPHRIDTRWCLTRLW